MATITKKKLIQTISSTKGLHPNDVRNVIQAFLDAMTDTLSQGDRLEFRDFGVFEVVERKQKIGRNPKKAASANCDSCAQSREIYSWQENAQTY